MSYEKLQSELDITDAVRTLHKWSLPTRIIEVGCGVTLSNLLFSMPNASHTIYDSYSPYDREAQIKIDPEIANHRAVSLENTKILLRSLIDEQRQFCYYVANFQIGGNGMEDLKVTHGYIGVAGGANVKATYYHITIPGIYNRQYYLKEIAKIGLAILFNKQLDIHKIADVKPLLIEHVDAIYDSEFGQEIDKTLELFLANDEIGQDLEDTDEILCYSAGKFHRFEDFFRDKKKALIYRGTFNPITKAHLEIFEKAVAQEQPDIACLMIAYQIYGKPGLNLAEIKQRLEYADVLGIPMLIGASFRYLDTVKHLRKRQMYNYDTEFQFLMGADTIERIFDFEKENFFMNPELANVVYLYVNRANHDISDTLLKKFDIINGGPEIHEKEFLRIKHVTEFEDTSAISATRVRELIELEEMEELVQLVPEKLMKLIINSNFYHH